MDEITGGSARDDRVDPGRSARPRTRGRRIALAGASLALAFQLGTSARAPSMSDARLSLASVPGGRDVIPATWRRSSRAGEGLLELLGGSGVSVTERSHMVELARPYVNPEKLPAGVVAEYVDGGPGRPERVTLRLDRDRTLRFEIVGARWVARVDSVPVTRDTVVVAGRVSSHLYSATLSGDVGRLSASEKGDLAGHLSRVFAWQIDFYREVRPGDAFRLALERESRPDGSVRTSRVVAAEYMSAGTRLAAFRFRPADQARAFFYDEEGGALRGAFLKAPLDLIRVTSHFSGQRFHPMLGRYRSHRGVDYGAAAGTAVKATGAGTIERAGWWGDYGLLIEVRHADGIRTRYAHLSSVERGVRPGGAVVQGQTIGRVGSTGLSTATHLHYEFSLRGIPTDPARVDLPVERPIPEADRERFAVARAAVWLLLARVSWPGDPFPVTYARRVGTGGHTGP